MRLAIEQHLMSSDVIIIVVNAILTWCMHLWQSTDSFTRPCEWWVIFFLQPFSKKVLATLSLFPWYARHYLMSRIQAFTDQTRHATSTGSKRPHFLRIPFLWRKFYFDSFPKAPCEDGTHHSIEIVNQTSSLTTTWSPVKKNKKLCPYNLPALKSNLYHFTQAASIWELLLCGKCSRDCASPIATIITSPSLG